MGCTCDQKQFRPIIVFFCSVHISIFECSPVAHDLIFAKNVCQEVISLTISGSCGKDPPIAHTHLATVPMPSRKGVKNRLFSDNPQVPGIIVAIPNGGSDKYGVSNPKELKVISIFSLKSYLPLIRLYVHRTFATN